LPVILLVTVLLALPQVAPSATTRPTSPATLSPQ
jgi:hypothetical protein